MSKQPVRRASDGKVRVWGLGWAKPGTAAWLAVAVIVMAILIFGFHI